MKFLAIVFALALSGCAAGLATYEYEHNYGNGEVVKAKVTSPNEIGYMEMGIEAQADGSKELKVTVDKMTKNDNTAEVTGNIRGIVSDVVSLRNPLATGDSQ